MRDIVSDSDISLTIFRTPTRVYKGIITGNIKLSRSLSQVIFQRGVLAVRKF